MEQKSIWAEYTKICKEQGHGTKLVGKCGSCTKSQMCKDTEHRIAKVEGIKQQENDAPMDEETFPKTGAPSTAVDNWCCMYWVLSLQEDFLTEKPTIQSIIENAGHVCLFLPRFHCELNLIKMLWGYAKHCT